MRFTVNQIILFSAAVWTAFIGASLLIDPEYIFDILNPIVIAIGAVIIVVFAGGFTDAFKNRNEGITLAHVLTFGVSLNWIGAVIRMARWYVTGRHPTVTVDIEFWLYNFGLWCSVWGGLFLIGAGALVGRRFRVSTLLAVFFIVFGFLYYLENAENADIWYNWVNSYTGHGQ